METSYGFGVQVQHVAKTGFIFGLQGGYQILRSKVSLNGVYRSDLNYETLNYLVAPGPDVASGKTILQSQDIFLTPYIGYRLKVNKLKIDLMPGFDLGLDVNSHEYGKATDNAGNVFQTDGDRGKFPADFRVNFRAAVSYYEFSVIAGFSQGITNFSNRLLNDSPIPFYTHTQLISLGIAYRIK
jgi:cobyric acid synthase